MPASNLQHKMVSPYTAPTSLKLLMFQRSILPPLSGPSSPRKIPMLSKILVIPSCQHTYSWCWDLIKADTGKRSTSFCSTLFSVPFFLDYLTLLKEAVYSSETSLTLRRLMSYIYGAPILDVSRSHTTTQHSR